MRTISHPWANGGDDSNKPVVQILDNDNIVIVADGDTDADGSPRVGSIDPVSGQSETSLRRSNGWKGSYQYCDSEIIPFFVLPLNWAEVTGIPCKMGDMALVSYKGFSVFAIFADQGPKKRIGELSICAIEALSGNPWNQSRTKIISGLGHGVRYEIIPGSANLDRTVDWDSIQAYGEELFGVDAKPAKIPSKPSTPIWIDLKRGSTGDRVLELQKESNAHFDAQLKEDGIFGPKTEIAVDKIKPILGFAANGVVDERTWSAIKLLSGLKSDITPKPSVPVPAPSPIPTPSPVPSSAAAAFVAFYKVHYDLVRAEVNRWFTGVYSPTPVKNGCVAHVVSCLRLVELPSPALNKMAAINVDYFVEWAEAQGWKRITDMTALKPGDVCVSGPSLSDIDHVYAFVAYIDKNNAKVLHNQVYGLAVRSLIGDGCGRWRFALRMP